MQDQHSISVSSEIRRSLPPRLARQVSKLDIMLIGEKTERTKMGIRIKVKGYIELHGEIPNEHSRGKIVNAVRERSGGRRVEDLMTAKRESPVKRRFRGFF